MWRSRRQIIDTYVDHMHSVKMSGCGHEGSNAEILSHMRTTLAEFDEGQTFPSFSQL